MKSPLCLEAYTTKEIENKIWARLMKLEHERGKITPSEAAAMLAKWLME